MSAAHDCVVVAFARTPFGKFGGALKAIPTPRLGALAINEVVRRARLAPEQVESLHAGVAMIGAGALTPARQMLLQSSLSERTPSLTVDRACCSGMTAIGLAMRAIACSDAEIVIAGGAENLSATPRLLPREWGGRPGPMAVEDPLALRAPFIDGSIATYTGEEALRHGISRAEQDAWALQSHQRYFAAEESGAFASERFAAAGLEQDEGPRRDTSLEKLASLKTVYGSPTITAGNAPGLNDGAAFVMLATQGRAEREGLPILARLRAYSEVAGGKTSGTSTPAEAITVTLKRAGLGLDAIDLIEINEAYAATPLVSTLRLAEGDKARARALRERTNVNGGAVAIGHPMGASGARLVMTLASALRQRGGGRGVAAICGGFGQGDAILVEVDR